MKSCRKAGPWKDIAKSSIKSSQKQVLDAVPLLVAPVSILEASTRLGLPAGEFSGSPTVPTDKSPAIGPDTEVGLWLWVLRSTGFVLWPIIGKEALHRKTTSPDNFNFEAPYWVRTITDWEI